MFKAFGIVNSSERNIHVEGLQDYRAIGAFSFLGRYRVIDFPISNMTNSGIEYIQVISNSSFQSIPESTISITPISTTTTPIWSASKQFIIRMLLSLRIT